MDCFDRRTPVGLPCLPNINDKCLIISLKIYAHASLRFCMYSCGLQWFVRGKMERQVVKWDRIFSRPSESEVGMEIRHFH